MHKFYHGSTHLQYHGPYLQNANLTQGSLADLFILIRLLELLDGNNLPGLFMACLQDDAVCAAKEGG